MIMLTTPFNKLDGTKYLLDIWAEGRWKGIILYHGEIKIKRLKS